jgi:siroheme synthase
VPAFAGIPVTHRDHAHSFMVIAGSRSHDLESGDWQAAAALIQAGGTVVILMGLARLQAIVQSLIARQCSATTLVAVISKGSYLIQDCRVGTLDDIAGRLDGMKAPAILVIGEVVSLRDRIQWMELASKLEQE